MVPLLLWRHSLSRTDDVSGSHDGSIGSCHRFGTYVALLGERTLTEQESRAEGAIPGSVQTYSNDCGAPTRRRVRTKLPLHYALTRESATS